MDDFYSAQQYIDPHTPVARSSPRPGIRTSGSQWLLIPETKNMSLEQIQHFLQYGDDPANRPSNPDTDGLQSLIDPVRLRSL